MADREERLMAMHPRLFAYFNPETGQMDSRSTGWVRLNDYTYYHETSIDLSGYARDDLSFFPTSVGIQDPGVYTNSQTDPAVTGSVLQVLDIISSVPIADVQTVADLCLAGVAPGMLESVYEFGTIMMGSYRLYTNDNSFQAFAGLQTLHTSQRFDSGEPTAADKLFCYRIVHAFVDPFGTPAPGTLIRAPATRQLIAGVMVEEPELVHMFRLKRSYELANQVRSV